MCEVFANIFEECFPQIESCMRKSTYIAIDSEFSGLSSKEELKGSLFDGPEERYAKLRQNLELVIPLQIGLSCFTFIREQNKYSVQTYSFYIFPRPFGSIDHRFLIQSAAFEFLRQYNFDFNKCFYNGISFLSKVQEDQIYKELHEGSFFRHSERFLLLVDERKIQSECSNVSEWIASCVLGDTIKIEVDKNKEVLAYFLHKELRRRFPTIWTYSENDGIRVEKVSSNLRSKLDFEDEEAKELEKSILLYQTGFSRVFKLLCSLNKPIVGHNLLLDIMIMYNQFLEPLPALYRDFKKKVHSLFPNIFDTKYLSFELRENLPKEDKWSSNSLDGLYQYLSEGRGSQIILYSPSVEVPPEFQSKNSNLYFHDAGWDSYCTGVCFIKMAHIFAGKLLKRDSRPMTSTEHFTSVAHMKNCVNVIRASVSFLCFDREDPKSTRPQWLCVQAKNCKRLDIFQITELFARYGSVDIKPCSRQRALVAVGNFVCARDILNNFKKHPDFKVNNYSVLKHSQVARSMLWFSFIFSGTLCGFLIHRTMMKS